ncbi:MAG: S8 family serine peptidase [Rhodobacter sp.]|nr:S8 family serine peptidase [Rhodobacter sp.]
MTDEVRLGDIHTALGPGSFALAPDGRPEYIAVGSTDDADAIASALVGAGAAILRQRDYPNLGRRAFIVDLQALPLPDARQVLAAGAPGASFDIHALYRYAEAAPRLYAAALINQPDSPACTLPGEVRIGLIDGPVAVDHSALLGAALTTHSVLKANDPPVPPDHGTAVAALLIGQDDSGTFAGFATGAQLFAASAFSRHGVRVATHVERIGAALDWLVANDVQLINMSFTGPVNAALDDLLAATAGKGAILIAAAGNEGREIDVYPAAAEPVISVTAVDAGLRRYRSANTGAHIEFAAPGVDLYVARRQGGHYASGTSYAAPIITALAARLVTQGARSAGAVRTQMRDQTRDLGEPGRDIQFGWGLVRATTC